MPKTDERNENQWRYEVRIGTGPGDPLARFEDAENAFRYVLLLQDNSPILYRVWDIVMETFVDSLDFAKP